MPEFRCRLGTPSGEILERDYTAESAEALRRDLERKDYLILRIRRRSAVAAAMSDLGRARRGVKTQEFLVFNQELSALIRAGLPIAQSLEILLERRKNPTFRAALADVRERVKAGESLSEAFAAQGLFPAIYSASLASGERSGEIATVLQRYIEYTKTMLAVRKKVVSALIYPVILLALTIGLVQILLYFVLPKFQAFFQGFGAELPLLTRSLIGFSTFMRDNVLFVGAGFFLATGGLLLYARTRSGRFMIDGLKLKIPLIGPIIHKYAISRFTRTLSTLVSGGIPVVASLEIVARAVGNTRFEEALLGVTQRVREGEALWQSLEETGLFSEMSVEMMLFSEMSVEMIKVGESTGALAEMLSQVSDFLDEEIDHRLGIVVSLVEPIMLIVMAAIVATILLAIYYPLLKIYAQTKGGF
jgi:type IV pilus assembly protein PilC